MKQETFKRCVEIQNSLTKFKIFKEAFVDKDGEEQINLQGFVMAAPLPDNVKLTMVQEFINAVTYASTEHIKALTEEVERL